MSDTSAGADFDLLDFSIPSARGGKKPKGQLVWFGEPRELGLADLDLLAGGYAIGDKAPAVKAIRASHHSLAKALASGFRPGMAGSMTGYSASRVSILQSDPAFQELVEYYKAEVNDVFIDAQKRLADLGLDAITELQERLEVSPESFGNKDLMSLVEVTMDRSVAPSKKAQAAIGGPAAPALPSIQIHFIQGPEGETPIRPPQITIEPMGEAGSESVDQ